MSPPGSSGSRSSLVLALLLGMTVVIAVISAAITPTVDPFNMMLVMAPLLGLYCLSILLAVIPYRARQRAQ